MSRLVRWCTFFIIMGVILTTHEMTVAQPADSQDSKESEARALDVDALEGITCRYQNDALIILDEDGNEFAYPHSAFRVQGCSPYYTNVTYCYNHTQYTEVCYKGAWYCYALGCYTAATGCC